MQLLIYVNDETARSWIIISDKTINICWEMIFKLTKENIVYIVKNLNDSIDNFIGINFVNYERIQCIFYDFHCLFT